MMPWMILALAFGSFFLDPAIFSKPTSINPAQTFMEGHCPHPEVTVPQDEPAPSETESDAAATETAKRDALRTAVQQLLKMQEDSGRWSYEAYHQDPGEPGRLPYGFQVGGTSIVSEALLLAAPQDKDVMAAVHHGLAFVLQALEHKKMAPLKTKTYDVRIWGHCFALQFLCQVRALKKAGQHAQAVDRWIPRLVETIAEEENAKGGWDYGQAKNPTAFVTAPVAQSLLFALSQGEKIPEGLLDRCRKVLEEARTKNGAFVYEGTANKPVSAGGGLPGSAGRSVLCETTLILLGGGSPEALQFALDNFYKHWRELEKRRAKAGTHAGRYGIAPYYFYYAHRYAAQLIELLPEEKRARERGRLAETVLKTRDEDGTWNDRYAKLHKRSRNVGTAFAMLALLAEKTPLPPRLSDIKAKDQGRREF
ncbi:MAG: hypothetical protein HY716_16830 [Planctomycetes bacterium]|nr:hypothetical protein [Planctomycetota bacterium]